MAPFIYPEYPPQISAAEQANLLSVLNDWAAAHGLLVRPPPGPSGQVDNSDGGAVVTAPVALFPSPFPRSCFETGLKIQEAYNSLYAAIASDEPWLQNIMKELVLVDDYIESLWSIHLKVKEEGYAQDLALGLFRSDYMVHVEPSEANPTPCLRQVEFNTIASSFGGLSTRVSALHKFLDSSKVYPAKNIIQPSALPPNEATDGLAAGLAAAHEAYGASRSQPALPLCVLFVVQEPERNMFDQRHLEYALASRGVLVFRLPFNSTMTQTAISNDNSGRPLIYTPPHSPSTSYEATVLYFRATYSPSEFDSPDAWQARYHLERSAAIKCPSILTHLAGTKKVQQVLATPSSPDLERFVPDKANAQAIRETFAAIYPLDDSEAGQEAKKLALSPETSVGYVLKPQREGGGNNVYRGAIPSFLKELSGEKGDESKWTGHILMEIIEPPAQRNSLFRGGEVRTGEVVAELGVYGACLWDSKGVRYNKEAGYLLRTKGRESEEGGVAAGFGTVDSVCLVDV